VQVHLWLPRDTDVVLRALATRRGQTLSGAVAYIVQSYIQDGRARTNSSVTTAPGLTGVDVVSNNPREANASSPHGKSRKRGG